MTIHLPIDTLVADAFSEDAQTAFFPTNEIPNGWMGLDIGPKTRAHFAEVIALSKTFCGMAPLVSLRWRLFAGGTIALDGLLLKPLKKAPFPWSVEATL